MEVANQEELKLWGGKRVRKLNNLTNRQLLQAIKETKEEEIRNHERPAVFDGVLCGCTSCCIVTATQSLCGLPVPGVGACEAGLVAGAVCGVAQGINSSVMHSPRILRRLTRHCTGLEDHLRARKAYLDGQYQHEMEMAAAASRAYASN